MAESHASYDHDVDVGFTTLVLAKLESVLATQSKLLESQSRVEAALSLLGDPKTLKVSTSLIVSKASGCGDGGWPKTLCARYAMNIASTETLRESVRKYSVSSNRRDDGSPKSKEYFVILPDSTLLLWLDFLSIVFVLWDLTTTPFLLAWDLRYSGIMLVTAWISPFFWALNVSMQFLMAFYHKGQLETRKRVIAARYMKSWFTLDVLLVMIDLLFLGILADPDSPDEVRSWLRGLRLARLVRIFELLRMTSRVLRKWDLYAERKFSEVNQLVMSLAVPTLYILWGLHWLACLFYSAGSSQTSDTGQHWLDNAESIMLGSLTYQYLSSYHWAIATVSLAGNFETAVTNSSERVVMIFALCIGFIFGSVFISFISGAIVDYQIKQYAKNTRLRDLRTYLCENKVRPIIYESVVRQAEQNLLQSTYLKEVDVSALNSISANLLVAVRLEVQWPPLKRHPLFRLFEMIDVEVPRRLCNQALSFVDLSIGEALFNESEDACSGYILSLGLLLYTQNPETSRVNHRTTTQVLVGQWLSEPALFAHWSHVGTSEARLTSRVLKVSAESVRRELLSRNVVVKDVAMAYGCEYYRRLIDAVPPTDWPSDLRVPCTDYCEIVSSLPREFQITIGKLAVGTMYGNQQGLLNEVDKGKAVVIVTGEGTVYRIKTIVVLSIMRGDGCVFAQLGKVNDASVKVAVTFPACTLENGELISECLQRSLDSKFSFLLGKVNSTHTQCEINESESKDFRVQTRYYRNVVSMNFREDEEIMLEAVTVGEVEYSRQGGRQSRLAAPRAVFIDWNSEGFATLYAWLTRQELHQFSGNEGKETLLAWSSSLQSSLQSRLEKNVVV